MILGKINNDGKAMKGGSNFLVNKLNFFHQYHFQVQVCKEVNLSFP